MKPEDLMVSAQRYEAQNPGVYALSFWSWPMLTAEEIAKRVGPGQLRHSELRQSTARRIRDLIVSDGRPLELERTGMKEGHYSLYLPSPLNTDDLVVLAQAFDPPQPNPVGEKVRRNA
jgi:hypothetical protein